MSQDYHFVAVHDWFPPDESTIYTVPLGSNPLRDDPMTVLEDLIERKGFYGDSRLFSAEIREGDKVLVRYLSPRAATLRSAPKGVHEWRQNGLYVDGKKVPEIQEGVYELVSQRRDFMTYVSQVRKMWNKAMGYDPDLFPELTSEFGAVFINPITAINVRNNLREVMRRDPGSLKMGVVSKPSKAEQLSLRYEMRLLERYANAEPYWVKAA